jgi:hypothetical protein
MAKATKRSPARKPARKISPRGDAMKKARAAEKRKRTRALNAPQRPMTAAEEKRAAAGLGKIAKNLKDAAKKLRGVRAPKKSAAKKSGKLAPSRTAQFEKPFGSAAKKTAAKKGGSRGGRSSKAAGSARRSGSAKGSGERTAVRRMPKATARDTGVRRTVGRRRNEPGAVGGKKRRNVQPENESLPVQRVLHPGGHAESNRPELAVPVEGTVEERPDNSAAGELVGGFDDQDHPGSIQGAELTDEAIADGPADDPVDGGGVEGWPEIDHDDADEDGDTRDDHDDDDQ